jgi:hypothetical protein
MNTFAQVSIVIATVVGLIEIRGIENIEKIMFVTFLAMRIV